MIDLSQELIFSLIIKAFLSGAALGVMYESVRICRLLMFSDRSRMRRAASHIFVFFTDIIFCIVAASVAILLTYNISGGVFRGCLYAAMISGLLLYRVTLGHLLYKIESAAVKLIKKVIKAVLGVLFYPIKMLFSFFILLYRLTIGKIIVKIICRTRVKREKSRKKSENACEVPIMTDITQEEEDNAEKYNGYGKEDRISFGRGRGA